MAIAPNSSALEIQKKLLGTRTTNLTPVELNTLFKTPITPEFNVLLYYALQRNTINADIAVVQAITAAKTKDYLIPIALCLRHGVDTNMYVAMPKIGTVHILGYIYLTLGGDKFLSGADESVLNAIVTMFVSKNSRPALPMFDYSAGKINDTDPILPASSLSVSEWLSDQGYNSILKRMSTGDPLELQSIFDPDSLAIISILLDNPALMNRSYESRDMHPAIRAFSPISIDRIPISQTKIGMDYKNLDDAVTNLNYSAFDKLVTLGQAPSYVLINRIITTMKLYMSQNRVIPFQELEKMLLAAINTGTELDQDQMSLISTINQNVLDAVQQAYKQPYWRKICKTSSTIVTPELQRIAWSLNLDANLNKGTICSALGELSKADKDALKQAALKRQQDRMSADVAYTNEYIGDAKPVLYCRNRSVLTDDPFDYNDMDLAYYRDDQGAIWCFTSDTFAAVLETGINPYNSTPLPDSFKQRVAYQKSVLEKLGLAVGKGNVGIYKSKINRTYTRAIDDLTSADSVDEQKSAQAIQTLHTLSLENGISASYIDNITKVQMVRALQTIGYNVDFSEISTNHALITTARILSYVNKQDPMIIRNFFSALNTF